MSTLILLLMMAGQEPMYITDHPELPLLSFVINDEAIVTIMPDGSVTYGKGFNADSAAKKFYESYGNLLRAQGRYTQQDVIDAYRLGQADPRRILPAEVRDGKKWVKQQ